MGSIIRPTSNIPLTAPAIPGMLKELKGCCFNPPVWLGRGKLYLIVVTPNPAYQTIAGFYEVPDKGIVTYIKDFKLLQVSMWNEAMNRAFIFEAVEGDPPLDWKPESQFDYRKYQIDQIVLRRQNSGCNENHRNKV
ncbi:MAG: hypothetical protein WAW31_10160 [Smithella sp.]